MLTRAIPKTGELLPVIGLGTWSTFDTSDPEPLRPVIDHFAAAGATVIDSSPMYGRAELVTGALTEGKKLFYATKVWTTGKKRGEEQMRTSMQRMRVKQIDLMQIHNLVDWAVHLETLRDWKAQGIVRYIGITHYQLNTFDEMERILRTEELDFIQLPYSAGVREAEKRLLPAAQETKTAVLVMRPFEEGSLLQRLRGQPLPSWAAELDATTWSEVLLKFILAHPAVTCPIPATSKLAHLKDNLRAGSGRLPDAALKKKIIAAIS